MALTKAELVQNLIEGLGMHKQDAKPLVDQFFETIKEALVSGAAVKLSGFGTFELRDKRQRPGRNPKTGEEFPITARLVVTFKSGQHLKAIVEHPALRTASSSVEGDY